MGLVGKRYSAVTDREGRFRFHGLIVGQTYHIAILERGWKPYGEWRELHRTWRFEAQPGLDARTLQVARSYHWAIARRATRPSWGWAWRQEEVDLPDWLDKTGGGRWTTPDLSFRRRLHEMAADKGLEILRFGGATHVGGAPWPERGTLRYAEQSKGTLQLHLHGVPLAIEVPIVRGDLFSEDDVLVLPITTPESTGTLVHFRFLGLRGEETPPPGVVITPVDKAMRGQCGGLVRPVEGQEPLLLPPGQYYATPHKTQGWMRRGLTMPVMEFHVGTHELTIPLQFDVPVNVVTCHLQDESGLPLSRMILNQLPAAARTATCATGCCRPSSSTWENPPSVAVPATWASRGTQLGS